MAPISYFGRHRSGKFARFLYALTFDLDGVGMPQLRDVLHQMDKGILPKATFVVRVYEWRQQHPEGRKADCHRDTGLDPKTIRKWCDCPPPPLRFRDGHITVSVEPSQAVSNFLVAALAEND